RNLVLKYLQVLEQDRGVHGVESSGEAKADIVVFIGALAVHADAAQRVREFVVIGEDRPAVTEAAERFGGKEARRGRKPEGAELAALVAGAKALRRVVKHEQPFGLG